MTCHVRAFFHSKPNSYAFKHGMLSILCTTYAIVAYHMENYQFRFSFSTAIDSINSGVEARMHVDVSVSVCSRYAEL